MDALIVAEKTILTTALSSDSFLIFDQAILQPKVNERPQSQNRDTFIDSLFSNTLKLPWPSSRDDMIMDQSIEGVFAENAGLLRFRRLSYGDHHRSTRALITEESFDNETGDEK